jgi:hypothetical protein
MSTIKVNTVTKRTGSTLTLGESGTTVTLACGASQSGFGRTGTVDWCTTAKTSPFTSVSGNGYFVNTTGGAVTVTLPASPNAGDIVAFSDYASTFACNALTICRNSSKINGGCFNGSVSTEGAAITLVYVDGTRGWKQVNDATLNVSGVPSFITATGGTVTTSGDYKIHTFNSTSSFAITTAPTPANNKVSYVVVAGGGASGQDQSGGGGAGGYREGKHSTDPYTASPLAATPCSALTIAASTTYPITIGAGGAGAPYPSTTAPGSDSVFSSITSAGGGGGGSQGPAPLKPGQAGGSGGGGAEATPGFAGGAGNTPPVSPSQGNAGGAGSNTNYGGGGGGAGEAGNTDGGGYGGDGVTSSINATPTARAGGGGSGSTPNTPAGLPGGDGGGGTGAYPSASQGPITNGAANTGGGAGASTGYQVGYQDGNNGGSGVVIIRYKFQ